MRCVAPAPSDGAANGSGVDTVAVHNKTQNGSTAAAETAAVAAAAAAAAATTGDAPTRVDFAIGRQRSACCVRPSLAQVARPHAGSHAPWNHNRPRHPPSSIHPSIHPFIRPFPSSLSRTRRPCLAPFVSISLVSPSSRRSRQQRKQRRTQRVDFRVDQEREREKTVPRRATGGSGQPI